MATYFPDATQLVQPNRLLSEWTLLWILVKYGKKGPSRTTSTPEIVERVRQVVLKSSKRSAREHAASHAIPDHTGKRIPHEGLKFHWQWCINSIQEISFQERGDVAAFIENLLHGALLFFSLCMPILWLFGVHYPELTLLDHDFLKIKINHRHFWSISSWLRNFAFSNLKKWIWEKCGFKKTTAHAKQSGPPSKYHFQEVVKKYLKSVFYIKEE